MRELYRGEANHNDAREHNIRPVDGDPVGCSGDVYRDVGVGKSALTLGTCMRKPAALLGVSGLMGDDYFIMDGAGNKP